MKTVVISVDELIEIIEARIEHVISKIPTKEEKSEEKIITRYDVAKIFGISLVTVNEWCRKGILCPHYMNSRVYFYKSEVMEVFASSKGGRRGK